MSTIHKKPNHRPGEIPTVNLGTFPQKNRKKRDDFSLLLGKKKIKIY